MCTANDFYYAEIVTILDFLSEIFGKFWNIQTRATENVRARTADCDRQVTS